MTPVGWGGKSSRRPAPNRKFRPENFPLRSSKTDTQSSGVLIAGARHWPCNKSRPENRILQSTNPPVPQSQSKNQTRHNGNPVEPAALSGGKFRGEMRKAKRKERKNRRCRKCTQSVRRETNIIIYFVTRCELACQPCVCLHSIYISLDIYIYICIDIYATGHAPSVGRRPTQRGA